MMSRLMVMMRGSVVVSGRLMVMLTRICHVGVIIIGVKPLLAAIRA
jgi:hypothetical protein